MPSSIEPREGAPAQATGLGWFVHHLAQCVCVYDAAGTCLLANEALLRWLGRGAAEVVGRSLFELWPADLARREEADLQLVREGGRIEQVETRPGEAGDRRVRAAKFPLARPFEGMVVVFEEVPAAPATSLGRPEAVGRLALGIVHDFNNALTLLRGQLCLAEEALAGDPLARQALEGMRSVLDHACALPRQLLSFLRDERPLRQRLDMSTLARSLEVLLRPRLGPGTAVECRAAPGAWVVGDPVQLTQALLNLAGNALDAMPQGGRLLLDVRRVALGGAEGQGVAFVRVAVHDNGPGIAADVLSRIFEPLFTTRAPGGGSGLGLTVVQEVVQRHGGWVTCQSTPGEGTCFVLHLPACAGEASPPARRPCVLVLESDPDIRRLTVMILEQGRFRPEAVEGVARAREAAAGGEVDVVLVSADYCQGAEREALRQLLADLPSAALVVTTTGEAPQLPEAWATSYHALVSKPFSADRLLHAVARALPGQA
jgi:signal transduction histidine kinase